MKNNKKFIEALKEVASHGEKFTKGADEYLNGLREKLADGEIDKKTAIIELKTQVELTSDYLEELKVYQKPLNRFKQYRDIIMDCKDARRALKKEIDLYENDILPESKSKLLIKQINPIHWLKGEESLRQFLDTIKSAGLIESRETDEIIQEHFRQTGQTPQPIQWSKSNRLLIYLFNKLTETGLIDTMDRQFQLITEHFLDKKGQPFKRDSLKQDNQNMKYSSDPRGSKTIDRIIQELSV